MYCYNMMLKIRAVPKIKCLPPWCHFESHFISGILSVSHSPPQKKEHQKEIYKFGDVNKHNQFFDVSHRSHRI